MTTNPAAPVPATDEMPGSPDQLAEWRPGCQTWRFPLVGGQWGEMTVWPDEGRGAVVFGAASQWGDWDPASRILTLDGGERIDADGLSVE